MPYLFVRPLRTRRLCAAVLACASALFAASPAAAQNLTLAEAQRLALQRSRQLAGADFAIEAARQMAVAAGQLPDPVIKAGIDNLPVSGADRYNVGSDFMTMRRIGVSQEVTATDKRRLRAQSYELQADKASAAKDASAAAIERDTALAWLEAYFARETADVIIAQLAQARDAAGVAEGAYRGGRGSQADVFAAKSAVLAAQDRVSDAERRVRSAATMLTRWTGAEAAPLAHLPDMDSIVLDPATLGSVLAHHPEIAVLARQEAIAQTEAKLADANRSADWSLEVAFQQRGSAYSNMVSFGVSVPLQWNRKNRQDRELAARLAASGQAKAEREEALRAHEAETKSMILEWDSNRERHARYQRELLPLENERVDATLAAYRGGKASLADVLAARRAQTDARLQVIQLQADVARLWAQLNFLLPTNGAAAHAAPISSKDAK
jgi:outer membrane protein TolC